MPAHNFRNALSAWNPRPANDNAPLTADSFATLAERRAFVQRPQRDANQVLNCPQLERFGRTSPEVVPLWRHWRDLQAAPAHDVYVGPEIVVDEGEEPANTGFSEAGESMLSAITAALADGARGCVTNGQVENLGMCAQDLPQLAFFRLPRLLTLGETFEGRAIVGENNLKKAA